jgi:hypothetical protein
MAKYRVYMSTVVSFSVAVEAEDPDSAIEKAYEHEPRICAQCSGWGQRHTLDLGDDWQPDAVTLDGADAWVAKENWCRVHEGTDR